MNTLRSRMKTDGERIVVYSVALAVLQYSKLLEISQDNMIFSLHTCSFFASCTSPAGSTSRRLSKFTFSRPDRSIISLLCAKKAATTSPNTPPRPKVQKLRLLLGFGRFFSVFSFSSVTTRRTCGRSGSGVGSRETSDEELPFPPPKRFRKKDMGGEEAEREGARDRQTILMLRKISEHEFNS